MAYGGLTGCSRTTRRPQLRRYIIGCTLTGALRMPVSVIDDPEHWLARAEEARRMADYLTNATAREHMLNCAKSYERIAEMARQRLLREQESRNR